MATKALIALPKVLQQQQTIVGLQLLQRSGKKAKAVIRQGKKETSDSPKLFTKTFGFVQEVCFILREMRATS